MSSPGVAVNIERLRCAAPVLAGARGRPVADVAALADLLVRVGALVEHGDVAELDLNPVVVHDAGKGVTVLDAWIVLRAR
ncbi:acetate--CoA ligase family protein [Frankia sp. Cas3]|uniref:acetate--CoA ligase family protein n=1 Tax=Frankia sp. Cas3 TaxID=3073926 RepID=UPI002AD1DD4B|nr:acetate--CoA ligase family protein [Frankia sp. Cas3]